MASGDELAPFVLTNVEGLHDSSQEREKGSGAYGVVYKVSVNGMPCIAKRLHAILTTGVSVRERDSIQAKFRNECIILSKLRHPNVVHFVGVCYDKTPDKISLIMERLHTDLSHVLDTQADIPLPDKLSILLDVSYGLLYLHTSHPPIIHRDLTAPNILLTQDLRAKIADLGVSKLLSSQALAAHTQTKGPGQILYMPPEALTENPKYGTKLDVFSFGHMAIYVMTQEFPNVFEVTITVEILTRGVLQILKRQTALSKLGKDHCMYPLITQCLIDDSEKRPTTKHLNAKLVELQATHPKVETPGEIQDLQRQISSLRVDHQKKVSTLESSVAVSQRKVTSLESDLAFSQGKITRLENYLAACQKNITSLETEQKEREEKKTLGSTRPPAPGPPARGPPPPLPPMRYPSSDPPPLPPMRYPSSDPPPLPPMRYPSSDPPPLPPMEYPSSDSLTLPPMEYTYPSSDPPPPPPMQYPSSDYVTLSPMEYTDLPPLPLLQFPSSDPPPPPPTSSDYPFIPPMEYSSSDSPSPPPAYPPQESSEPEDDIPYNRTQYELAYPPPQAAYPPQDQYPSVMDPPQQYPPQAVAPIPPQEPTYPATYVTNPAQRDVNGRLTVTIAQAKLVKKYWITKMNLYCRVMIKRSTDQSSYDTPIYPNAGKNPRWNNKFSRTLRLASGVTISAYFQIFNRKYSSRGHDDRRIAWAHYELPQSLFDGETIIEEWIALSGKQGDGKEGNLNVILSFTEHARPLQKRMLDM